MLAYPVPSLLPTDQNGDGVISLDEVRSNPVCLLLSLLNANPYFSQMTAYLESVFVLMAEAHPELAASLSAPIEEIAAATAEVTHPPLC